MLFLLPTPAFSISLQVRSSRSRAARGILKGGAAGRKSRKISFAAADADDIEDPIEDSEEEGRQQAVKAAKARAPQARGEYYLYMHCWLMSPRFELEVA